MLITGRLLALNLTRVVAWLTTTIEYIVYSIVYIPTTLPQKRYDKSKSKKLFELISF